MLTPHYLLKASIDKPIVNNVALLELRLILYLVVYRLPLSINSRATIEINHE